MMVSVARPRKSTLSMPSAFEDAHLELGDRLDGRVFRAAGRAVQRQVFDDAACR